MKLHSYKRAFNQPLRTAFEQYNKNVNSVYDFKLIVILDKVSICIVSMFWALYEFPPFLLKLISIIKTLCKNKKIQDF